MANNARDERNFFKPFNPLFLIKVSAVLKGMTIPRETLKEMGINPDYVKQNKKGNTIIPCKVSPETGLVLNPGIRPHFWLLSTKESRWEEGNRKTAQVVAGENGKKLKGTLSQDGQVFFSTNQSGTIYIVQATEEQKGRSSQDFVVVRKFKLIQNKDKDQNYLSVSLVFPPPKDQKVRNDFNFFHLTPMRLLEVVREHLPKEVEFLAESIEAALEKVHADEDYPAYAELREPKKEPKQESKDPETSILPETSPEDKEEISVLPEILPVDPKDSEKKEKKEKKKGPGSKQAKRGKEADQERAAEEEIKEVQEDSESEEPVIKDIGSKKTLDSSENFSGGDFGAHLRQALKDKKAEETKKETKQSKSKSKSKPKKK